MSQFVEGQAYSAAVKLALSGARRLDAAVAFWGADADEYLNGRDSDAPTRLICNLQSGACNPHVIRSLSKRFEVRTLDRLHAKVIIADEDVFVGSANVSANGLSHESAAAAAWIEAGIHTTDAAIARDVQAWFELAWIQAREVRKLDLEEAEKLWQQRRTTLISSSGAVGRLIASLPNEELAGADVYFAIYQEPSSEEAESELAAAQSQVDPSLAERLTMWEDWKELPRNSTLISVYIPPRGKPRIEGAYVRLLDDRPLPGTDRTIQLVLESDDVLGQPFTPRQKVALQKLCAAAIRQHWESRPADSYGVLLRLDQAVREARATTS